MSRRLQNLAACGLLASLLLAACGQVPLLKMASQDYAPVKVGATWAFVDASGALAFTDTIVARGVFFGRDAYQRDRYYVGLGLTSTAYLAYSGSAIEQYSASQSAWILARMLPYVRENRWDVPTGLTWSAVKIWVGENENLSLPYGPVNDCYLLKVDNTVMSGPTSSTTSTLIWVAPGLGDVQYGYLDASKTVQVTALLSAYTPGP